MALLTLSATLKKFKQFSPTCDRSDIQNCSAEELVNTYDNTIAYSDFINACY